MTNNTESAFARDAAGRCAGVAETGAHGPPGREGAGRLRRGLAASLMAITAATTLTATASVASAAPPAHVTQAASPAPTVATSTTAVSDGAVSHSGKGTAVNFRNESGTAFKVGDHTIGAGGQHRIEGRSGDGDDISTTITGPSGQQVPLYGHNPRASEAYLQFGGQKVFNNCKVQVAGMVLDVSYSWDSGAHKTWSVKAVNQSPFAHEFIHHTEEDDGVKGIVTNKSSAEATVRLGAADLKLAPGQSLLFFDAHDYGHGNRGTQMHINGSGHPGYELKAIDPHLGATWVEVSGCGKADRSNFSEGQSRTYNWDPGWKTDPKLRVDVTRDHDGRMEVPYENWHTTDWARYTITISN